MGRRQVRKWAYNVAAGLAVWTGLGGCQSPEKASDPSQGEEGPTHYTLDLGPEHHKTPGLPVKRSIWVQWHKGAAEGRRVEGFRGYDFNEDGRLDMVEALDDDGEVAARLFDFDGDGRVDARRAGADEPLELTGAELP